MLNLDMRFRFHRRQEEMKETVKRYEDSNLARLLKNDSAVNKYSDHSGSLVSPTHIFGQINEKGE